MKKILFLLLIASMVLAVSSCKRSEVTDPAWDGPSGFNILLEGFASPSVLLLDGIQRTSVITVSVTDYKGNPLVGKTILFQQADSTFNWLELGFFENNKPTIVKTSDANGKATAVFFLPGDIDFAGIEALMFIRVLMVVDGRTDGFSLPQDFISILLEHAN